ncbi:MAG TPA: hypothetical protein DHV28_00325 [Ignavibacteriales bacterium]|nr:hypothetical protein [Ignavibacteriales bacterium]
MQQNFKPDLGQHIKKGFGTYGTHHFYGAIIAELFYTGNNLYSFSCTMTFEEVTYAVTFDFTQMQLFELLQELGNEELITLILPVFGTAFIEPQKLILENNFISVEVECILGQPVTGAYETFIPFIVQKFLNPQFVHN